MHTSKSIPLKDLKIDWRKHTVKMKGNKIIATVDDEGNFTTTEESTAVRDEVIAYVKKWKETRNID